MELSACSFHLFTSLKMYTRITFLSNKGKKKVNSEINVDYTINKILIVSVIFDKQEKQMLITISTNSFVFRNLVQTLK